MDITLTQKITLRIYILSLIEVLIISRRLDRAWTGALRQDCLD